MTAPIPIPGSEKWQEKYLAPQSQWQDMKSGGEFRMILVFAFVVATLYTFGYAINQFDRWLLAINSQTLFNVLLLRINLIVLTPLILLFLGMRFIFGHAAKLIDKIYSPKGDEKIPTLIRYRLFGAPPLPPPLDGFVKYETIVISPSHPDLDENHWARWFGGPATLIIYDGFAAYLERGNQFSRVVGPSFPPPFLERYERIREIIDLRPQTKSYEVKPWTKDGICITLTVEAKFRIDASAEALKQSSTVRYPFDPVAVKAVVESAAVRMKGDQPEEQTWLDTAGGTITGAVNSFVAGHSLDELFVAPRTENHANRNHLSHETPEHIEQIFSHAIAEGVTNTARERLEPYGIHVSNIQITKLEIHDEILDLRTRYWESIKLKIAAQRNSRAEADHIRARELAHAEAQRTMLTTIMTKLEKVDSNDLTEALTLSLSGILDQNLEDPFIRPLIAKESFAVLERVKKLLNDRF